jgi:maleylpyruvate isomerase
MTSPTTDLTALRDATDRLLATVGTLDDAAVAQPSLLAGWTRGHVLAHIARNADALVNVLAGRPMYVSDEVRDAEIERDAGRPLAVHRDDVRDSAARLDDAAASLTDEQWQTTVELRGGVTDLAATIPLRRWVEVELHHIDLGAGQTVAELPGAFLDRALDYLAKRFRGRPGLPPVELRAEDGRSWLTGSSPGDGTVVVAGTPAALVGWLSGRTTGSGLTTTGGEPLPALPPL